MRFVACTCCAHFALFAATLPALAGVQNTLVCDLRGDQEVPAVVSAGHGCGRFVIDTNANTLDYYIVYSGLTGPATSAHIHGPANPGQNAGVQHALTVGSPMQGTWNYPEAQEANILDGKMYVNIHTAVFPGGEIRGQIAKMIATIDALQEVPPVACPTAIGWGVFTIDTCANRLSYHINLSGILCGNETAAHIHGTATHGANAGVLHTLPAGNPKIGIWSYPESVEIDLLQGLTYVNIHTDLFPAGAVRGQITNLVAPIDSRQQVPANGSPAVGCAYLSLDKDGDVLGYYIRHTPTLIDTAAHIHGFAAPGANAGVLHNLGVGNPKLGTWSYPAADEPDILAGLTYINIHSAAFPGGEIRGQIEIPPKKVCDEPTCPWDCGQPADGEVSVVDFLAMLAQWGQVGSSCDFDGGGVGVTDFLKLLASWGPCP
ncbi:MAG: CHRD domain-containing protein [Planctomycetota bacterium]|jgi:hypothetical protein